MALSISGGACSPITLEFLVLQKTEKRNVDDVGPFSEKRQGQEGKFPRPKWASNRFVVLWIVYMFLLCEYGSRFIEHEQQTSLYVRFTCCSPQFYKRLRVLVTALHGQLYQALQRLAV